MSEGKPQVRIYHHVCKMCGEAFESTANNSKFCDLCRHERRRQQSQETYARFLAREEIRKMQERAMKGSTAAGKEIDGIPVNYRADALNMLAWNAGLSYGKIRIWAHFHPEEYGKWLQELKKRYKKAKKDGTLPKNGFVILPRYVPESLPKRIEPPPHGWSTERHTVRK